MSSGHRGFDFWSLSRHKFIDFLLSDFDRIGAAGFPITHRDDFKFHRNVQDKIQGRGIVVQVVFTGFGIIGAQPDQTDAGYESRVFHKSQGQGGQFTNSDHGEFLCGFLPGAVRYKFHCIHAVIHGRIKVGPNVGERRIRSF